MLEVNLWGVIHGHGAFLPARLVRTRRDPRPRVHFNVPSEFNQWWASPPKGQPDDWTQRFDYSSTTGTPEDGLTCVVHADGSVTTSGT